MGCSAFRLARFGPARGATGAALVVVGTLVVLVLAPAARALTPPRIYWANFGSGTIGEANLDGTGANQGFITGATGPDGVAVNGSHIYWTNFSNKSIGEANLDGSDVNQSFITGAMGASGVAANGSHIYWANFGSGTIGEANLDGSGVNESFITGASEPTAVAVDGSHIYWANYDSDTIGEATLDGTGVNQSFITGASTATGPAVDGSHMYWTNTLPGTIGEANLDGTGANQSFITGARTPEGPAVDGSHIYWANFGSGTIGEANLDGTGVNQSFITGASEPTAVAVSVPVTQASTPAVFPTTPQGTLSAPETLTVSNAGQQNLSITGLTFTGSDPGDFTVSSNACLGAVAPGERCQITVQFAPQGQGARSATLQIQSNDYANSPLAVPVSGTGGSLPQGPTGPTGHPGSRGPAGPTGAQGPAGKVELITCKTVIKKVRGHRRTVQKCTGRLVSGTIKFTATALSVHATISRGRLVYAAGASLPMGHGRSQLLLADLRPLRSGRYTLTVRTRHGGRRVTRRMAITIGR